MREKSSGSQGAARAQKRGSGLGRPAPAFVAPGLPSTGAEFRIWVWRILRLIMVLRTLGGFKHMPAGPGINPPEHRLIVIHPF